jgi:pimeloyl-ACP methyl ester carboxylesterase
MAEWVLRQRFVTDKAEIAWDRLGDGPPVVMVHGTPLSWSRTSRQRLEVVARDAAGNRGAPGRVKFKVVR